MPQNRNDRHNRTVMGSVPPPPQLKGCHPTASWRPCPPLIAVVNTQLCHSEYLTNSARPTIIASYDQADRSCWWVDI